MAKRFDSTTKQLVEEHPADWLALAGLPSWPPAEVVDADLSSFTHAADKLIRVWELPVEAILSGGLGTLPLAPIAAVERPRLPDVYRRIAAPLAQESKKQRADELWLATYILSRLRYPPDESGAIMRGVLNGWDTLLEEVDRK